MLISIQHSRTPSHQPSLARPGGLQLPTEVLDIIVGYLTRRDLLSSSKVCKAWRPSASHQLWKNIDSLPLNEEFMLLVPAHGHLIHRLDVILHPKSKLKGAPGDLLAQVLQDTPRLHHLSIRLLEYDSNDIVPPVLKAIKDYVSGQLTSLELKGMSYHIEIEDVKALFPSLTHLTRFEMDGLPNGNLVQMLTSLPFLTAIAFRGERNTNRRAGTMRREVFQNVGIVAIGTLLPLLKDLTVHFNKNILAVGLGHFSEFCPQLTRVDLRGCQGILSDGLASFLGAQPHLTHVCLADTLLQDSGLLILAKPDRAAQLRVLNIRKCRLVQAHGVGQVVRACVNLRELNFSLCSAVWMDVFTGTWACLGLLRLNFGGIHRPVPVQDGSDAYVSRSVQEGELEQMYAQLGRLHLLEELTLLPLPFQLRLFELGRTSIENMTRLEHISLVDRASALEDRDIIWLATRLPSLKTLDLDECTTRGTLLRDLGDINKSLKINRLYSRDLYDFRDPNLQDIDVEYYDAMDSDYSDSDSDSDSDGDNNHHFGIGGGGNYEDDSDEDDSDDPYYSPGEEPYQPAHLNLYNSDEDDDGANIYPSAIPSSNSDDYETYDGDDDDDLRGHGGNSFWDYRASYYPPSDSDKPFAYNRGSQDDPDEGAKEDSSEEDSSGSDDSGDAISSDSEGGDSGSQSELSSQAESVTEEDDSSGSDDSGDGTSSDSEDSDRGGQSELSSQTESDTEEDDDEDDIAYGSDSSSKVDSVGNFSDDNGSQSGGEHSDMFLSADDEGSEDGSSAENDEDEQEGFGDEEDGEEQYSDEQDVDEEDVDVGKTYLDDHYDENDGDGHYAHNEYDYDMDHNDKDDGYEDYDGNAVSNNINAGGYDSDDY
ncbi:RNI-like protein [Linnemannia elongata AG-77]|uniref:RNI-like protein n=1 Tax=Linnemannia elongata AG-77 TaxID=1314771 RepID=A0A197KBA8_9FUNG|nr:RNI-like protein [Linnemannia elongata AG-77]